MGSLSKKVVKSSFWVLFSKGATRFLTFAKIILVTRLLFPEDMGLFGIAMLALATLEKLSLTGFEQAIVQKKDDVKPYLDTAWTVQLLRAVILSLILFWGAPYIALFFKEPGAEGLMRVIALGFLITGFNNIGVILFNRQIEFSRLFRYEFWGSFADFIVSIGFALWLQNAWALILGYIARNIVRAIVSFCIQNRRPKLSLDWYKVKELLDYGQWVWAFSILMFLLTQGDDALVGRVLGAAALGLYQLAYKISYMPTTEVTHALLQVIFPALCRLQDDYNKLKSSLGKVFEMNTFISFPISVLIFSLADYFASVFLTEQWLPVVPVIRVLCFYSIARTINASLATVFNAIGKPKVVTVGFFIQFLFFAIIVYPFTKRWGLIGTGFATIIPNILFFIYIVIRLNRTLDGGMLQILSRAIPPALGSLALWVAISFLKTPLPDPNLFSLTLLALSGAVAFLTISLLTSKLFGGSITDSFRLMLDRGEKNL